MSAPHFVCLAFMMSFSAAPGSAEDRPNLTGTWQRNAEKSDDPREVLGRAREQMGRGGPGGRGGGLGGPRGGFGGPKGRRPGGGPGMGPPAELLRELEIEQSESELKIAAGESVRIFYLDAKKHEREEPDGAKVDTIAQWKGDAIEVLQKGGPFEVSETYEVSPDRKILVVTRRMKNARLKEPLVVRNVYDRVEKSEGVPRNR